MKTSKTTPTTISRRERPAKAALTRQGIIDAALAILREEGLGKVTMRRIAAALDTGPASLYVYVRDTEDLHAQILDALLANVLKGRANGDWRTQIKALLRRYMAVLFAHPALARMAMSTPASGGHYVSLVDRLLGLLQEGGASNQHAAWGVDMLLLHATADAAEHGTWKESPRAARDFATLETAIANVDARKHPHVARLGPELMAGGEARQEWALDLLISGVTGARP